MMPNDDARLAKRARACARLRRVKRTAQRLVISIALSAPCALACILHATPARAQTAEAPGTAASAWTSEATKLEEAGRYREALDRWKHAAAIASTPSIVFHIGLCESRSGALVEAAADLERAIALARTANDAEVEAAAQAALSETRARTPTLELDVPEGSAPSRVILDGTELSTSTVGTPMPLNPGAHTVVVVFGPRRVEKDVTLASGDATKLAVAPPNAGDVGAVDPNATQNADGPSADAGDGAVPLPSSSLSSAQEGTARSGHFLPIFLLVSGVAVTGAGVAFWVFRTNEIKALERVCPTHTGCDPVYRKHDSDGKLYTSASLALLSSGIIGMGWGAGMLIFSGKEDTNVVAKVVGGLVARVVPEALPGGGGASVVGRF